MRAMRLMRRMVSVYRPTSGPAQEKQVLIASSPICESFYNRIPKVLEVFAAKPRCWRFFGRLGRLRVDVSCFACNSVRHESGQSYSHAH